MSTVPPYRSFRCVNRRLYFGMMLSVTAAAAYAFISGRLPEFWQQLAASACAVITLLWGSFYTTLHIELLREGILCRIWFFHLFLRWPLLQRVELSEFDVKGIQHCSLLFVFPGKKIEISSHLFSPDDVRELRDDLYACKLLGRTSEQTH